MCARGCSEQSLKVGIWGKKIPIIPPLLPSTSSFPPVQPWAAHGGTWEGAAGKDGHGSVPQQNPQPRSSGARPSSSRPGSGAPETAREVPGAAWASAAHRLQQPLSKETQSGAGPGPGRRGAERHSPAGPALLCFAQKQNHLRKARKLLFLSFVVDVQRKEKEMKYFHKQTRNLERKTEKNLLVQKVFIWHFLKKCLFRFGVFWPLRTYRMFVCKSASSFTKISAKTSKAPFVSTLQGVVLVPAPPPRNRCPSDGGTDCCPAPPAQGTHGCSGPRGAAPWCRQLGRGVAGEWGRAARSAAAHSSFPAPVTPRGKRFGNRQK